MIARTVLIFSLTLVSFTSFSQGDKITLPYERSFDLKGIPTKMYFLKISLDTHGALVDMIFGFQNPTTKEWLFFDAFDVPLSQEGFFTPFLLKLKKGFRDSETGFINDILQQQTENTFLWKCGCNENLPDLPI